MINSVTICFSYISSLSYCISHLKMSVPSTLSVSFLSSPSGSGRNLDDLLRGGGQVIVRLLQEIPLVGEWLKCGGVVVVKWL